MSWVLAVLWCWLIGIAGLLSALMTPYKLANELSRGKRNLDLIYVVTIVSAGSAANKGIGYAIAHQLAEAGLRTVVTARNGVHESRAKGVSDKNLLLFKYACSGVCQAHAVGT